MYQNPYMMMYQKPAGYSGQIIQVNGKAGAEALQMEPNSSVYVQDSTKGDRIFLLMTDGAGYKSVKGIIGVFEEEQEKAQQESAIASLEARIKRLEDTLNGYVANDAKRIEPSNGKDSSNAQSGKR